MIHLVMSLTDEQLAQMPPEQAAQLVDIRRKVIEQQGAMR
jgi:hypothetical protein